MKKLCFFLISIILCYNIGAYSAVGDWTTFTNQGDVRDLLVQGNNIWCATNGGVFKYEIATGIYSQFNNTNGLNSNDAQAIEVDMSGKIWVGFSNGFLNFYDSESNQWDLVQDYSGHAIYDLKAVGDSLLVALDIGISLYDIRRQEVKETYKNLGRYLPVEIPVLSVSLNGKEIWAATEFGIAKSSFDLANLMAPESWTNYTITQGLPSNIIYKIVDHCDSIFAATGQGIAVLAGQEWQSVNNGLSYLQVFDLISNNGSLYALTAGAVHLWKKPTLTWQKIGSDLAALKCFVADASNNLWIGRQRRTDTGGFAKLGFPNWEWAEFTPPGPPGNDFSCLTMDSNGVLWCGTGADGVFRYDGTTWTQFTKQDGLPANRIEVITVDSQNKKWIGTIGGGIAIIDQNDKLATIIQENHLSEAVGAPDYIVITDIKIDRYNNVWILNLAAVNSRVVAVFTAQQEWQYFTMQEGILSSAVRALAFDSYDRVWIASDGGVNVIDYNNTLMNKSDDDFSGTLTTVDGLESNFVKDISIDLDNICWIGTESGLNYWSGGVVYDQYGILSKSINEVEIDARNNKWFGTSAGVSILAPDGYTWTHYTTDNTPLVSDNITSFAFDYETGKVYIGTTNGLSCVETPYSKPLEDLSQVTAGPNPFFPDGSNQFFFSKLADDVAIKIMTEQGNVIHEISNEAILGSQATWDGRNEAGNFVASGIYIYVIYNDETGLNLVGKMAVIH